MAALPRRDWDAPGGPVFSAVVFLAGTVTEFVEPSLVKYVRPNALGGVGIRCLPRAPPTLAFVHVSIRSLWPAAKPKQPDNNPFAQPKE